MFDDVKGLHCKVLHKETMITSLFQFWKRHFWQSAACKAELVFRDDQCFSATCCPEVIWWVGVNIT